VELSNNYVERLNVDDKIAKSFNILATSSNVLHNYFIVQTKLLLDLYLAKFLDTLVKLSFRVCVSETGFRNQILDGPRAIQESLLPDSVIDSF